jgi:hypothetical protein
MRVFLSSVGPGGPLAIESRRRSCARTCPRPASDLRKLSYVRRTVTAVFEGDDYGVAVTAAPVVLPPWPVEMPPLGVDGSPVRLGQ